jgi:hypothetical protein
MLLKVLAPAAPTPTGNGISMDQQITHLREHADFSPAVEEQIRTGMPVSPQEKALAASRLAVLKKDGAWVRRFFDGDREANKEMMLLNLILSSRVRDPGQQ